MAQLRPARSAVPSSATILYEKAGQSPAWSDGCDGKSGAGWTEVGYDIHFSTPVPAAELFASASAALVARGWEGGAPRPDGPGQGARWTRTIHHRDEPVTHAPEARGSAVLTNNNPDGAWTLTVGAPPIGKTESGC
jgi:hypothetical protein